MLETLAAWVLRTYVGEYVENLNTDQLSIGYGTVDLHNLPLKKTALKGLELPLEVKSGYISHLQLSIPLRRPKSEPWIVHINKLFLVAGPLQHTEYDAEAEKNLERARKQKHLDALEAQWHASRQANQQGGFWSGSWWPSLYSSLSTTIAENLQLVISDVHFRYEDATTEENMSFAFGITIDKLSAQSTNETWDPEVLIQNERVMKYKLIELQNMSLYWDTDVTLVGDLPSQDLEDGLHRMINRNQGTAAFSTHQYILEPTSAQAKLKRNSSALPLRSRDMPRFVVDVHVEEIPFSLAEVQYRTLMKLMTEFERYFRLRKYRKWRPLVPVIRNAKAWWQFAGGCVLHFIQERNKRHTLKYAAQRAHDVVRYVKVYTKHLTLGTVDSASKEEQQRIEDELTFEELVVLRNLAMAKAAKHAPDQREAEAQADAGESSGGSWQAWLTGWYWSGTDSTDSGKPESSLPFQAEPPSTKEEAEFLDELTDSHANDSIFNRDHVFAHLNFHLNRGSFKLHTNESVDSAQPHSAPLIEVEFSNVRWDSEMRPRSSTWECSMSLGALFVRDKATQGTLFPALVSPQSRELKKSVQVTKGETVGALAMSATSLGLNVLPEIVGPPVFEMKFEQLRPGSKVTYRLAVTTQPLDVVYNPTVYERVSEFFSQGSTRAQSLLIERQLREVARVRYEELKNQTKAELVNTLGSMMEGDLGQSKRWDIHLEISAPRFILPESFKESKASLVLIDFGHLRLLNTDSVQGETVDLSEDMEDDSFVTPPSTPPSEEEDGPPLSLQAETLASELSEDKLLEALYDKYTLNLSDTQVVVCKVNDKWSQLTNQSFSAGDPHVVEKFTISVQMERRLVFTADPKFPAVAVTGQLPNLVFHINEQKLQALSKCVTNLSGPKKSPSPVASEQVLTSSTPLPRRDEMETSIDDFYYSMHASSINLADAFEESTAQRRPTITFESTIADKTNELMEESRKLLLDFTMERVSLAVHSRGFLIAELQISGVSAKLVKRPFDQTISFAVHGLHLVDAIQSYGPNYELLLTSCNTAREKHLEADTTSSVSEGKKTVREHVTDVFSAVATEVQNFVRPDFKSSPLWSEQEQGRSKDVSSLDATTTPDEEDLIKIDYVQTNPEHPSVKESDGKALKTATLSFNTISMIANQETLAALVQFFGHAFPSSESSVPADPQLVRQKSDASAQYVFPAEEQESDTIELHVSFHAISVLLIRSVKLRGTKAARKVADISVSNLVVHALLGNEQAIDGSLGGLAVLDLTPEGRMYKTVFTCGCPLDRANLPSWTLAEDIVDGPSLQSAFMFTLLNPTRGTHHQRILADVPSGTDAERNEIARNIQVKVHTASAQYVYTHRFVSELMLCAGDYAGYAAELGESIRQAASSVAMNLVSKRRALAEGLGYLSSSFASPVDSSVHSVVSDEGHDIALEGQDLEDGSARQTSKRVYVTVTVETPVVHVPKSSRSSDRFVAQLGKIDIRNSHLMELVEDQESGAAVEHDVDRLSMEIKDMSLYFLSVSENDPSSASLTTSLTSDGTFTDSGTHVHILHKTAFQLTLDRRSEVAPTFGLVKPKTPAIQLVGKVATPLQLELSTLSYKELLETLDNLGGGKETGVVPPPFGSMPLPFSSSPPPSKCPSESILEAAFPETPLPTKRIKFDAKMFGKECRDETGEESFQPMEEETSLEEHTPITALMEVPHFSIKLCGELNEAQCDFVDIMLHDFYMSYDHTKATLTTFDVSLGGLLVEDLLQDPDSSYRHLMSSSVPHREKFRQRSLSAFPSISTSCPSVSDVGLTYSLSSSMPLYSSRPFTRHGPLKPLSPLRPLVKRQRFSSLNVVDTIAEVEDTEEQKATEQSMEGGDEGSALVHIKVLLVDEKDEEFDSKYKSVDRLIDVDFSSLDTVINLQTWVVVFEFFGIGVPQVPSSEPVTPVPSGRNLMWPESSEQVPTTSVSDDSGDATARSTEIKFRVSSFTLTLNKSAYPLATAKVTGLETCITLRDGDFAAKGTLACVSVLDMSPHGSLYKQKFTTCGDEALSFDFYRYGEPDINLLREYDLRLILRMPSVQYVHTKRFQTELVAFCQHFMQLQEVLGRMRAVSAGNEVSWMFSRGSRVHLDIKAGSPVMLLPRSAKSLHMMVADLGNLSICNQFVWDTEQGTHRGFRNKARTLSDTDREGLKHCLLDCMHIELVDMDLFTAVREQHDSHRLSYRSQGGKLLKEKCKLTLTVLRNLDWAFSRSVPDLELSGRLSSVSASIDYSQYCFVLGMLGENLGEPLEEFERPSSVLQDPLGKPPELSEVWTTLRMTMDLVNVSLELFPVQLFEHPEQDVEQALPSLAKINFIKSKFEFETFSDWSKTIDLVSQEVIFEDTRQKDQDTSEADPCVFTEVLLPLRVLDSEREDENYLQFEVHYRDTTKKTLMTFLFNHSRILMIIDYLLETYNFIMCKLFQAEAGSADQTLSPDDADEPSLRPSASPSASHVKEQTDVQNAQQQQQKTFELKVNISGTEFVVLENLKTPDSNAVVLKITAVLAWRPHIQSQKWLSCSVQNLEMFSCIFSCEEDTAQSIIDPTSALIELNNARRPSGRRAAGLLDITEEQLPSMEVNLQTALNMRISYTDYKLYLSIIEAVSKQLNKAIKMDTTAKSKEELPEHSFDQTLIARLQELGFTDADCIRALHATSGRLEASATWLLENATPILQQHQQEAESQMANGSSWHFAGFEVHTGTVCVCLIDDCGDSDVPLIEVSTQNMYFWHDLQSTGDGAAHGTLVVEYYNRNVSQWEPFIEPWKCQIHWQQQLRKSKGPVKVLAKLDAPDRLDITVTTTLIEMIRQTAASWSEDYYRPSSSASVNAPITSPSDLRQRSDSRQSTESTDSLRRNSLNRSESSAVSMWSSVSSHHKRRSPFVPYALRNHTGCTLLFATVTSTPSKMIMTSSGLTLAGQISTDQPTEGRMSEWREVMPGEEVPFEFKSREKLRHRGTHELNVHQVVVQVEGWEPVSPVSVDRVGIFFRLIQAQRAKNVGPVRVVFEVTLEGGARKVVTIRSALLINNKTDVPVEIRLQAPTLMQGAPSLPTLEAGASAAVPLANSLWNLYVRPHGVGAGFCSEPLAWKGVLRSHTTSSYSRECYTPLEEGKKFSFSVAVKREGYPEEGSYPLTPEPTPDRGVVTHAAHTIILLPPMMLVNLLPCDLCYQIKNVSAKGNLKAGKTIPLYTVDPDKAMDLEFSIENFTCCDNVRILKRSGLVEHPIHHVELQDQKKRSLFLVVKVVVKPGGSLKVSIYAPYWLVNNTGIPLIFKQDGVPHEMAGQFPEHEMARSLTPLLFSFSDRDAPARCQMRIGNSYHQGSGKPVWSNSFSLDSTREFKRVNARQESGRPDKNRTKTAGLGVACSVVSRDVVYHVQGGCFFSANAANNDRAVSLVTAKKWVYDIGIDVRFGRGRYRDTRIVTFAQQYQLVNKTQHTLAFSQRHFVRAKGTKNPDSTLTALPDALVLFHWERTDLDQLLCIRLNDVSHCQWSGGFRINRDDSFHVNMRSLNGCCLFVRVEVTLKGATYHVLFTDAAQLPPPFRVDNLSEVPLAFCQSGTEDRLRTELQAKQSVPYSWDEPTLSPELLVSVVGANSNARYNLEQLGSGDWLYYYNPIYIVFTHTFTSVDGHVCGSVHIKPAVKEHEGAFDLRELVLDVPQGTAVILRRKELHRRSQLWRMTGEGLLRHEGSSSSSDSRRFSSANTGLVLDIDSLAPPTCGKYVRLVLSRPNPRRKHSQTWAFTEDGRMKCDLPGLYVQPRSGIKGLLDGADCVLGPANITKVDHIPLEQCISTCKLRPGSGALCVNVLADGPTRVLQISDSRSQHEEDQAEKDWLLVERKGGMRQPTIRNLQSDPKSSELEVQVRLAGGIGVSVVSAVPEELVFLNLEQIEIDYTRTPKIETLETNVGRIQIDNQLFNSQLPVLLFATPQEKTDRDSREESPVPQQALHLSAAKEPSRQQNVEIFKNLDISLCKMTLQVEERLLLKLLQFLGYVQQEDDLTSNSEEEDVCLYDAQRSVVVSLPSSTKRYYFEKLQFNSTQLRISVAAAGRLPEDLQSLKSSLGLILVNLEDATVDFGTFSRFHPFDTVALHFDVISKHYMEELRGQAAAIVGSVDFLGNPMGLINDVSSGLEGLVKRGNVGGLFLNVAHGVSDSAAKITGSLSDGLWNASMDTKFQESREAMRAERFSSSQDHFFAGVKGLGMGIVGGLTSIVTQPIEGAHTSGLPGFITGLGKGLLGTVAKPTAGVLDFASGTAAAVRGQATRSTRYFPPKPTRLRRNCFGPSGAIPRYSSNHAEGQEIMLKLNGGNFNEKFVLSESVRRDKEDRLKTIVTTENVYFVRAKGVPSPESIVLLVRFSELYECQPLSSDNKDYIELVMKADNSSIPTPSRNPSKRPRVRCDTSSVSQKVAQKINYAKNLYNEVQQTLTPEPKEPTTP